MIDRFQVRAVSYTHLDVYKRQAVEGVVKKQVSNVFHDAMKKPTHVTASSYIMVATTWKNELGSNIIYTNNKIFV